jgi:hypothetical protein
MKCDGKDNERYRCGQQVQADIGEVKPTTGQNNGAPNAIAMVILLKIRRYLMSVYIDTNSAIAKPPRVA